MRQVIDTEYHGPNIGDIRYVHRFLWWPKTLVVSGTTLFQAKFERRWLEKAVIKQEYVRKVYHDDFALPVGHKDVWRDVSWMN